MWTPGLKTLECAILRTYVHGNSPNPPGFMELNHVADRGRLGMSLLTTKGNLRGGRRVFSIHVKKGTQEGTTWLGQTRENARKRDHRERASQRERESDSALSSDPTNNIISSRSERYRILYQRRDSQNRLRPDYYTRNYYCMKRKKNWV